MQHIKFIAAGILFGIILTKGEVISWFRIQEMFRFQSFHMYGIIGSAVVLGAIGVALIKKWQLKSSDGTVIQFKPKAALYKAALLGGIIFGAGWAATGACPGPLYILIGNGYWVALVALAGAIAGTYFYGLLKARLPH